MQTPVPEYMSFTDFYEQIWGTEQMMEMPVYGYLQLKSVQNALRGNAGLAPTLREMEIPDVPADIACIRHGDIVDILPEKYAVCSQTAAKALHDLGIEQPSNWWTIPPSIVWKSLRRSVSYVLLKARRILLRYQHSLAAESKAILPDPFLWNPSGDQGCLIIPLLDLF